MNLEQAITFAKQATGQSAVLYVSKDKVTLRDLPLSIATKGERIAAVVVEPYPEVPFFYKKARELSSAEGALLILNGQQELVSNQEFVADIHCIAGEVVAAKSYLALGVAPC